MFRFLVIFGLIGLLDVLWWYLADRRLRPLRWSPLWRSLLALFMGGLLVYMFGMVLAPSLARRSHHFIPMPINAAIYLWHLIVLPASLLTFLLISLGRGAAGLVRRSRVEEPTTSTPAQEAGPSRRQVLAAAAFALPPLVTAAAVGRSLSTVDKFRIRRLEMGIPNLPFDLDGLTIAHITDVHVGKFTTEGFLTRVADAANGLHADLHLLTGDLVDLSASDIPIAMSFLQRLDPKHGVAMCEGNHDLIDDARAFYAQTKAAGIPLLVDRGQTFRVKDRPTAVQVLGIRWGSPLGGRGGGSDRQMSDAVSRVAAQRADGAFPILLAHHPHAFDPAAAADFPLTLAGHTHGGLLMVNERVGPAAKMYRYWTGPYAKGNSRLFVSNGVGCWFPLRINSPAEISHLTLRRA